MSSEDSETLPDEEIEERLDAIEDPERFGNVDKEEWKRAKESIKEMPPWVEVCFAGECYDREKLLEHFERGSGTVELYTDFISNAVQARNKEELRGDLEEGGTV